MVHIKTFQIFESKSNNDLKDDIINFANCFTDSFFNTESNFKINPDEAIVYFTIIPKSKECNEFDSFMDLLRHFGIIFERNGYDIGIIVYRKNNIIYPTYQTDNTNHLKRLKDLRNPKFISFKDFFKFNNLGYYKTDMIYSGETELKRMFKNPPNHININDPIEIAISLKKN